MNWFSRRRGLEIENARQEVTISHMMNANLIMQYERDYWKNIAETLLDTTLFHRGEVRHHVFSKPPVEPDTETVTLNKIMSAMSRTEIGTAKRPDDSGVRDSQSPT